MSGVDLAARTPGVRLTRGFSLPAGTVEMLDGRGQVLVSQPYHRVARN